MNINLYSLGLMSGTSLDGIDVSIIKSDGEQHLEIIDDLYL
jgi:anhydro-N-acetylmuramic acid kinase